MQTISKRSLIQIEFTSDEVEALKEILSKYPGNNYKQFVAELKEMIS